jgi:PEP-CTERM motif
MKIFLWFSLIGAANASTVFIDSGAFDTNNSGHATVDLSGALHPNPGWAGALPGSEWISYGPTGNSHDPGYFSPPDGTDVTFTATFMLNGIITGGSLLVLTDDALSVTLNGHSLMSVDLPAAPPCAKGPSSCAISKERVSTFALLAPYLVDGANTLSFGVMQVAGSPFGLDFAGEVTTRRLDTSETPEPATLALFGSGLLMLAALRRRK